MSNEELIRQRWQDILNKIIKDNDVSNISYSSWLEPLEVCAADASTVSILVPTGNMGNMGINVLNKKYTAAIKKAITDVTGLSLELKYVTEEPADPVRDEVVSTATGHTNLNPKYTFESFVVGNNNQFAHAASLAVAESPGEIYNPLYLYAGVGLGKTHLMHSIAHFIMKNNPNAKVLYVTSEFFTNELIDSIRNGNNSAMSRFRDKYRNIDVLLIDDIQFIIGKESTQEEFFHTFEALYGAKKQIVVSSDKPPKDLNILEERIRSRLEMGLIADIAPPDYETRMAILRKKEEADGYQCNNDILDYIAKNIKSNIRELEGCLNRIHAKSKLEKREITLELASEILRDLITPDENRNVTSKIIIATVAEHFQLTPNELRSLRRDARMGYPRRIAMYLCREMTEDSLATIAKEFNRKDHTTVISALKKVSSDMEIDPETRNTVETLRKKILPGM